MSIPKHVTALANHKGAAILHAGGMLIPVKIMDIEHEESIYTGAKTTFKGMVVDTSSPSTRDLTNVGKMAHDVTAMAKAAANRVYGAPTFLDAFVRPDVTYVKAPSPFDIDHVLFNGPAAIVFWKNGDKTIVVSRNNEVYDMETDLALCFTLRRLGIAKVVFDKPTTTATWEDGTETVVKCQEGDVWSKETGLFTVIAKKTLGNKGNFNDVFKKHIPSY